MKEETRIRMEKYLKVVDDKIQNKEDNVRGGLYMSVVGIMGATYGVLTKSDSAFISGIIVSSGGLIFRVINNIFLDRLTFEKYSLKYALKNDNVNEYYSDRKGGKHFKK